MTSQLDLRSRDPKLAAKHLRSALKDRSIDLSHGECLDLVARELGLRDWNVLAAVRAGKAPPFTRLVAPPGWSLRGVHLGEYSGGIDPEETYRGKPVFWLRNATESTGGAALQQDIIADRYAGQRVRFSGWMRADAVDHIATIALGAFDTLGHFIFYYDLENLAVNGALRGNVGWSWRDIVKDIPAEATSLMIEFALRGRGEARFADLKLEIVGPEVPETRNTDRDAPANLDFAGLG
jgi:hypothetical protein